MDTTLLYSVLAGIAIVLLFIVARVALRWAFRLAIICLVLLIMLAGAWFWFHDSPHQPRANPRSAPAQRVSSNRQ